MEDGSLKNKLKLNLLKDNIALKEQNTEIELVEREEALIRQKQQQSSPIRAGSIAITVMELPNSRMNSEVEESGDNDSLVDRITIQ